MICAIVAVVNGLVALGIALLMRSQRLGFMETVEHQSKMIQDQHNYIIGLEGKLGLAQADLLRAGIGVSSRDRHLEFCKDRANDYLDSGDVAGAVKSMVSDMANHPDTMTHPALTHSVMFMRPDAAPESVRRWIDGFG